MPASAQVSIALNPGPSARDATTLPRTATPCAVDALRNRIFLDPLLAGSYPRT